MKTVGLALICNQVKKLAGFNMVEGLRAAHEVLNRCPLSG